MRPYRAWSRGLWSGVEPAQMWPRCGPHLHDNLLDLWSHTYPGDRTAVIKDQSQGTGEGACVFMGLFLERDKGRTWENLFAWTSVNPKKRQPKKIKNLYYYIHTR